MPDSSIVLPVDSTGKALRTFNRAANLHDQYVVTTNGRVVTGTYISQTGAHVVLAAAHAATAAGFWFLTNPVGSTVLVALRRIEFASQMGSILVTATSPRLQAERFTFTGTSTGAVIVAAKQATADATQVARLASATTGLTPTAGAAVFAFLPVASATAVAFVAAAVADWNPDADGQVILAAGEGVVFRQADAGTTADTRRFVTNIAWEEFTL